MSDKLVDEQAGHVAALVLHQNFTLAVSTALNGSPI